MGGEIMKCQFPTDNHSTDLIEVWHGADTPLILCGFHNRYVAKEAYEMTPCDKCGTLVKSDTHAEEIGLCLDCSNDYFDHTEEDN
jgi:hypothetical protein